MDFSHLSHVLRWLSIALLAVTLLPVAPVDATILGTGMPAAALRVKLVQGQALSPGETPVGLSTDAWRRIQSQIEADRSASVLNERAALSPPARVSTVTEVNNWGEVKKLTSAIEFGTAFGYDVALDGDTALVGARLEDGGSGNSIIQAGAAYIFARNEGGANNWGQVARLTASDPQAGHGFGHAVALDGDTALVGARRELGGPGDPSGGAGAAYIFDRNAGGANNWGEVKKLTASDTQADDEFGFAVALDGDMALVGAPYEDGGVGDPKTDTGAVYILDRNQGGANNWGEVKKLAASDAVGNDTFGYAVALDGDTALVGAIMGDGEVTDTGAVYILDRNQGGANNWGEVKKLAASDTPQTFDLFGASVALAGDTALVGRIGVSRGAYVFDRNQGGVNNWGEVKKLIPSNAEIAQNFGSRVALDGDVALVGASYEDGGPGDSKTDTGAAYIFARNQGGVNNWGEVKKLIASDAQAGDHFGGSVAMHGDTALVGKYLISGGGGDPAIQAGEAYIFQLTQSTLPPSAFLPLIRTEK